RCSAMCAERAYSKALSRTGPHSSREYALPETHDAHSWARAGAAMNFDSTITFLDLNPRSEADRERAMDERCHALTTRETVQMSTSDRVPESREEDAWLSDE